MIGASSTMIKECWMFGYAKNKLTLLVIFQFTFNFEDDRIWVK